MPTPMHNLIRAWNPGTDPGSGAAEAHPSAVSAAAMAVAARQLASYNARDIDAFAAVFHPEIVVFELDSGAERFRGLAALRERYGAQFRGQPAQRSEVLSRSAVGRFVFDLELLTGTLGPDGRPVSPFTIMAIYRVAPAPGRAASAEPGDWLIDRAWFTPRTAIEAATAPAPRGAKA